MQTAVVNFVRFGAPGPIGANDLAWPEYTAANQVMNYGSPDPDPFDFASNYAISVESSLLNGPKCERWQSAPYWYGPDPDDSDEVRSKVQLAKQRNYKDYEYELRK